jgi:hypothetical protein
MDVPCIAESVSSGGEIEVDGRKMWVYMRLLFKLPK